jgi:diketogulonate reductase-like aldo/keto reductase
MMGFGTFGVKDPMVIYNALSVGYRHLNLAEHYNNLPQVKHALSLAFASLSEGGLGIERKDIWITMKISYESINKIYALLMDVGTEYFNGTQKKIHEAMEQQLKQMAVDCSCVYIVVVRMYIYDVVLSIISINYLYDIKSINKLLEINNKPFT